MGRGDAVPRHCYRAIGGADVYDCIPVATTLVTTTWNSLDHLEIFLDHYRKLGVGRVLVMDFDSTDGTAEVLSHPRAP